MQFASAEACGLHVHSLGSAAAARAGGSATPFNRYGRRLFCAALCAGLGGGRTELVAAVVMDEVPLAAVSRAHATGSCRQSGRERA